LRQAPGAYIFADRLRNIERGAPGRMVCSVPLGSLLTKPLLPSVEMYF
jgi:hypothetical protein